jgi:hypothetical protein
VQAHVDAASACVRLGDESWPYELDWADVSAVVQLGGSTLRVRPLRWRERLALARFAHLGASFVEAQHLRIALGGAPVPASEEEQAAVAALAAWVDAPRDEAVPLETRVLAGVTLDVCRAMTLTPADLDGRDAYEVEALWRAAGRAAEWPRPLAGGNGRGATSSNVPAELWESELTRIEVVPDAEAAAPHEAPPPSEVGAAETPVEAAAKPRSAAAAEPAAPERRRRTRELAAVRGFAVIDEQEALDLLPQQQPPVLRQPVWEELLAERPTALEERAGPESPSVEPLSPPATRSVSRPIEPRRALLRSDVAPGVPAERAWLPARPAEDAAAAPARRPAPPASEHDRDRLLDERAHGLERAASALGVDLEA